MNQIDLNKIVEDHKLWLGDKTKGKRADLRDANLSGADLLGVNLRNADLRDANLNGADLIGANLRGADLRDANLNGADLSNANLKGANLRNADLRDANLYAANLSNANLSNTNLSNTKGILSFNGEEHILVYFKADNKYYFKIGCKTLTVKEWVEEFEDIGKEEGYDKETTRLYGDVIKLFSQYELFIGELNE
jgi:hypothetical protein